MMAVPALSETHLPYGAELEHSAEALRKLALSPSKLRQKFQTDADLVDLADLVVLCFVRLEHRGQPRLLHRVPEAESEAGQQTMNSNAYWYRPPLERPRRHFR